MPECYIRGSTIKYLRIPDEIIDMVKEEVVAKGRGRGGLQQQKQQKGRGMGGAGRGRRGALREGRVVAPTWTSPVSLSSCVPTGPGGRAGESPGPTSSG